MDDRQFRYCTTNDGVRIAYSVVGDGPFLLACPAFVEAASLGHLSDDYQAYVRRLAEGRRLITYDVRGTGMSDRECEDFSHEAMVRDIEAVVEAA